MTSARRLALAALAAALVGAVTGGGCSGGGPSSPEAPPAFDVRPNDRSVLVAFGDSISWGDESSDGQGYRRHLEDLLASAGRPGMHVINEGIPGTVAEEGAARIEEVLRRDRPAVLLLLYGTNDEAFGLPQSVLRRQVTTTSEYLRMIISAARANRTIVVVSTLPAICAPRLHQRDLAVSMNDKIRALALEMGASDLGVILADSWTDFLSTSPPDGCALIGPGGNHPTDTGYAVLAGSFFKALQKIAW
jgi:lysophospholipase L1-like esterase